MVYLRGVTLSSRVFGTRNRPTGYRPIRYPAFLTLLGENLILTKKLTSKEENVKKNGENRSDSMFSENTRPLTKAAESFNEESSALLCLLSKMISSAPPPPEATET